MSWSLSRAHVRAGIVAVLACLAMLATVVPAVADVPTSAPPGTAGTVVVDDDPGALPTLRYHGADRYDTARLIALEGWEQSERVVLARGDTFPDSLAGAYLAGVLNAPVLLTPPDALDDSVLSTLDELAATEVVALGGPVAIDPAVTAQVEDAGYDVSRIEGDDRFDTAARIATFGGAGEVGELQGDRTAFVATGLNFADALAAGAIAANARLPLLLTEHGTLPAVTAEAIEDLGLEHVILLGGEVAVAESVEDDIAALGVTVERVAGPTRVETALDLAALAQTRAGFDAATLNVARGSASPDALTIGPRAAQDASPVLLTSSSSALDVSDRSSLEDALPLFGCAPGLLRVVGGPVALTDGLVDDIRDGLTSDDACGLDVSASEAQVTTDEPSTVTATVTDQFGQPLGDVDVAFSSDEGDLSQDTVNTDDDGHATTDVTSDEEGTITVTATVTEAQTGTGTDLTGSVDVTFEDDAPAEPVADDLSIAPDTDTTQIDEAATFTATVLDQFGDPYEGAEVTFTTTPSGDAIADPAGDTGTTDADGLTAFTVASSEPGEITVTAAVDGLESATATLTIDDPTLSGVVSDISDVRPGEVGEPIEGATVSIDGEEVATTNAAGEYEVALAPGDYTVEVAADGFEAETSAVTVQQPTTEENLGLYPAAEAPDEAEVTTTGTGPQDVTPYPEWYSMPVLDADGIPLFTTAEEVEQIVSVRPGGKTVEVDLAGTTGTAWWRAPDNPTGQHAEGVHYLYYNIGSGTAPEWWELSVEFDAAHELIKVNGQEYPPVK